MLRVRLAFARSWSEFNESKNSPSKLRKLTVTLQVLILSTLRGRYICLFCQICHDRISYCLSLLPVSQQVNTSVRLASRLPHCLIWMIVEHDYSQPLKEQEILVALACSTSGFVYANQTLLVSLTENHRLSKLGSL